MDWNNAGIRSDSAVLRNQLLRRCADVMSATRVLWTLPFRPILTRALLTRATSQP